MEKVKLSNQAFIYPMPMVLVGAVVAGRPNFMAVAWVTRVNMRPPLLAVSIGAHYTRQGIQEHQQFSVNIPSVAWLEAVDYCGLVSGDQHDKAALFTLFQGTLEFAPLIQECAVALECQVVQTVPLPISTLFIGEIVGAYSEEQYLTDGKPDLEKIQPFTLTMPDNRYWRVGEVAGQAWSSGRHYRPA